MTVFDDLRDRLVVDWGRSTRSWVQRGLAKLVVEVRPRNFGADFPGYEDVVLSYADLQRIVAAPDANRIWHRVLAAVSGVYLIVDLQSGNQYVGSAYGDRGILGRWESYARTGHGDNARLRALLDEHPRGAESFQFSILRVLPRSMPSRDVVAIESAFKRKLGSRAFGLNAN